MHFLANTVKTAGHINLRTHSTMIETSALVQSVIDFSNVVEA